MGGEEGPEAISELRRLPQARLDPVFEEDVGSAAMPPAAASATIPGVTVAALPLLLASPSVAGLPLPPLRRVSMLFALLMARGEVA